MKTLPARREKLKELNLKSKKITSRLAFPQKLMKEHIGDFYN